MSVLFDCMIKVWVCHLPLISELQLWLADCHAVTMQLHSSGSRPESPVRLEANSSKRKTPSDRGTLREQWDSEWKAMLRCFWCLRGFNLILQGHDRIILGGIDMQNMVAVLGTKVVGDVCEGRAAGFGHTVVDNEQIITLCEHRGFTNCVMVLPLLHLTQLHPGHSAL